jgi:hypothetical protein
MRKLSIFISIFFSLLSSSITAQNERDTSYYRESPQFIALSEENLKASDAVIIEENRTVKVVGTSLTKTYHAIIHINTKEGLDDVNKIYIKVQSVNTGFADIFDLKARSISPSGKIVEFNDKNLKVVENIDKNQNLKIYAIEGAEVGGQIEYSYSHKTEFLIAEKIILSDENKILKSTIRFLVPSTHGLTTLVNNTTFIERNLNNVKVKIFEFQNIPLLLDEMYSIPEVNAASFEYYYSPLVKFRDYKNVYPRYGKGYFEFEKYEINQTLELISSFNENLKGKSTLSNNENSIRLIDSIIKKNYVSKNNLGSSKIKFLIQDRGFTLGNDITVRTYCSIFKQLGIEYQLILGTDKNDSKVNTSTYSPFTMEEFLFYFPKFNSYLYPLSRTIQYGLIPSWLGGTKGFLLKENMEDYSFVDIPELSATQNLTELKIKVNMAINDNSSIYTITGVGTGQVAANYNSLIFDASNEKELKQRKFDLVDWRYPQDSIIDVILDKPYSWGFAENCEDLACKKKYFATVKSTTFFELSDERIFLNIGQLIGPQDNLYSATERIHNITRQSNQTYQFEIKIPIPYGYIYSGEQNTVINNRFSDETGKEIASFKSTIEVVGNEIVIKILEEYHQTEVDKKYYELFRNVINSAADFNKAIVILSKK